MIENLLHLGGVPGHDDVDEQAQGIGNRLHLFGLLGLTAGDAAVIEGALQCVDSLAPVEHAQQFATKGLVEEIIAQEHGPAAEPRAVIGSGTRSLCFRTFPGSPCTSDS